MHPVSGPDQRHDLTNLRLFNNLGCDFCCRFLFFSFAFRGGWRWNKSRGVKSGDHGLSGGPVANWIGLWLIGMLLLASVSSSFLFLLCIVLHDLPRYDLSQETHSTYLLTAAASHTKVIFPTASIDFMSQTISPPRNIF